MKGASATARLIAASLVCMQRAGVARGRVPAPSLALAEAALCADGLGLRALRCALRFGWVRRICTAIEARLLPGIQWHYVLRKQRLHEWAMQAFAQGHTQLLILGAGLDGLGLTAAQIAAIDVVEFDHPATQAIKRGALQRLVSSPPNLRLHALDLANGSVSNALRNARLRRDEPTLIVAEGLLMYMSQWRCRRMVIELLAWFRGPLRAAFSVMQVDKLGRAGFPQAQRGVGAWLAQRDEPFRWGCTPAALASTLYRLDLQQLARHDPCSLPEPPASGWVPCPGEDMRLVERSATRPR